MTTKINRQPPSAVRTPPSTGPTLNPTACAAPWNPSPVPRRSDGRTSRISAYELAWSITAPIAWTIRATHEQPERRRERAGRRADDEDAEAVGVQELAADPVSDLADRRDGAGKDEHVDEHHPFDGSDRGVEVGAEEGQRGRDDARVELAHERPDAHGADREPGCRRALTDPRRPARFGEDPGRGPARWLGLSHRVSSARVHAAEAGRCGGHHVNTSSGTISAGAGATVDVAAR